jgi:hypothetical protein
MPPKKEQKPEEGTPKQGPSNQAGDKVFVDEDQPEEEMETPELATMLLKLGAMVTKIDEKVNPDGQGMDATYTGMVADLRKMKKGDFSKMMDNHKQELLNEARVLDSEKDIPAVIPPHRFGQQDFTEEHEKHLRNWRTGITNRSSDPKLPTIESVLRKMVNFHKAYNYVFSEDAWRQQLLMLLNLECKKDMEFYDKTGLPSSQYFPYLLTQHRSDVTQSEARALLQRATIDMEADPLATLIQIRDLVKRTDSNPLTYLDTCLQEADRYLRMYCGSAVSSLIRVAYNQRAIKNFQNFIDAAKDFNETIEEGHDKIKGRTKKARQVEVAAKEGSSSTGSEYTAHVNQLQQEGQMNPQIPQPPGQQGTPTNKFQPQGTRGGGADQKVCFKCNQPGHFRRECPVKDKPRPNPNTPSRNQRPSCALHPQANHSNANCQVQKNDPCCLHPGAGHGNMVCKRQQQPCWTHPGANHSQGECRMQTPYGQTGFGQGPQQRYQGQTPYNQNPRFSAPRPYNQLPQAGYQNQQYQPGFQNNRPYLLANVQGQQNSTYWPIQQPNPASLAIQQQPPKQNGSNQQPPQLVNGDGQSQGGC